MSTDAAAVPEFQSFAIDAIDFVKADGLVPAIVQDADSQTVLMLGYMNAAALARTQADGVVTFFSRSKGRLWTKGETSGHTLAVVEIRTDCDRDSLLIRARPNGPTCHTGTQSCFQSDLGRVMADLEQTVAERVGAAPETSYTARMLAAGLPKIAQKVGEEATEVVVAALAQSDAELSGEAADLLYHLTVLFAARKLSLRTVAEALEARRR